MVRGCEWEGSKDVVEVAGATEVPEDEVGRV